MRNSETGEIADTAALHSNVANLISRAAASAHDPPSPATLEDDQALVEHLSRLSPASTHSTEEQHRLWQDGAAYEPPTRDTVATAEPLFDKVEVPASAEDAEDAVAHTSALSRGVARVNRRARRRGRHRRSLSAPNAALAVRAAESFVVDGNTADDEMTSSASEDDGWSDITSPTAGAGGRTRDGEPMEALSRRRRSSGRGPPQAVVEGLLGVKERGGHSHAVHWEATQMLGGATVAEVDTRKYSLHIMDEGEPDFDFPECDPKVKIESTGEEDFALCLRETQSMVLHIRVKRSRASTGTAILRVMFRFPTMSTPGRQRGSNLADDSTASDSDGIRRRRSLSAGHLPDLDALAREHGVRLDSGGAAGVSVLPGAGAGGAARASSSMTGLVQSTPPVPIVGSLGGGHGHGGGPVHARARARARAAERARARGMSLGTPTLDPCALSTTSSGTRGRSRSHAVRGETDMRLDLAPVGRHSPPRGVPPAPGASAGAADANANASANANAGVLPPSLPPTAPAGARGYRLRAGSHHKSMSRGSSTSASASVSAPVSFPGAGSAAGGDGGSVGSGCSGASGSASANASAGGGGGMPLSGGGGGGGGGGGVGGSDGGEHRAPQRKMSWWHRLLGRTPGSKNARQRSRARSRSGSGSSAQSSHSRGAVFR